MKKQKRPPQWSKRCEAGVITMIENAKDNLRPDFITHIRTAIERKYTLPACMVSVGNLTRNALWRTYGAEWRVPINHVLLKAAYATTCEILEEYGAEITDYQTVRKGGTRGNKGAYRAIYRFPPLEKREK